MTQIDLFPTVTSLQPDILAPRLVLPAGTEKGKQTSDTSGLTSEQLYQQSIQTGWFLKMLEDTFRSALPQSSMTFQKKITQQSLYYYRLTVSAQYMREQEFISWPTPTTGAALCGGTGNFKKMQKLCDAGIIDENERQNLTQGNGGKSNPALMEWLMGYPEGWTDLKG